MAQPDPGSARDEAERLVAVAIAAARRYTGSAGPFADALAGAFGHQGARPAPETPPIATGSAECCVCPICRTIAAMRDPDPAFTERLATGAGDFAAGLASLMRSLFPNATPAPSPRQRDTPPRGGAAEDIWRTATRSGDDVGPPADGDVWSAATGSASGARPTKPMARKAVKKAAPAQPPEGDDA
jgi:hypothetical protein